ncbi:Nif11-like leader peptide family natural product precursor [Scytonema sp. UIC 10036]|uniref:Nif11-like leader peptide family natural product precursor n=1 Tax=Scytonema sp. UIC 10036 TaxID=2304196 RepID=UPI0012DA769D|nr:Nif11-like leader peptide family natural product precursor [Scytonema sp. UIC 10036]MUG95829.1 Nif11-like leader peptide family natural product precursor [Scytonema sp. UIC 10036]
MAKESLEQFKQVISNDVALQEKLRAIANPDTFIEQVVQLGEENGYSFTPEEAAEALAEIGDEEDELSTEQLASVAGGAKPETTVPQTCSGTWC